MAVCSVRRDELWRIPRKEACWLERSIIPQQLIGANATLLSYKLLDKKAVFGLG
jgi:hypothetical protein